MNDVDRNAPEIRFPGFTEPWEQRKLSDLLVLSSDRNDGKYTRDDVLAASLGTELVKKHIYFGLRATDESVKNYRIVSPGDIIYTKSPIKGFPNGIIRTNKGETGIVPTLYCVYHCVDTINPSIIQSYFEDKERLDNYLVPLVNIGARNNVNITDKGFLEGTICIPSNIDEQTRIVELIGKISSTITLHQRKCDELKIFKNGLLQKLFPLHGELYPSVRLHSFDGPWKLRKFEDIFTVSQGLQIPISERYTEPGENRYFYITNEFLKASCNEAYYIESPSESVLCDEEDILMTRTGNTGIVVTDVSGCFHNNFFKIAYDKQTYSKRFICYMLSSPAMHRVIMNNAGSSTIPDLSHKNFYRIEAAFPDSKEEQEQIGKLLFMLDKLINLQQLKCDELRNFKKGLLQKMFI